MTKGIFKKIELEDMPDVFLKDDKLTPELTIENFEFLIKQYNELIDHILFWKDKEATRRYYR